MVETGLSGPAEKCMSADGGTKWRHNFGWLQERAKDMIRFSPDEILQANQCLDRPPGVRGSFPRSGACSDKVTGTEVAEPRRSGKPAQNVSRM